MARFAALLAFFVVLFAAAEVRAADVARGRKILDARCVACHSLDGTAKVGPTLQGAWDTERRVTSDGAERTVRFDQGYLARALRDPDADVAVGFPRGNMPKFAYDDDEVASIGLAVAQLSAPPATPKSRDGFVWLGLSCFAFVGLHVLMSSRPVRTPLVAKLGKGFAGLYAVIIGVTFVGIVLGFRASPFAEVWTSPRWARWAPVLVMPIAIWFIGAGNAARGPTMTGGKMANDASPSGILRITRHPALTGFSLWALAHLAANGELRAVMVFVTILALSLIGMFHIDARRTAEHGEAWQRYAAQTSRFPFAAILSGRTRMVGSELKVRSVVVALVLYVLFVGAHPYVIGAWPLP